MNYGLPYKGSKSRIADEIYELFPVKKNFYDLFCGGCAMTHYALLRGDFEKFIINDIQGICPELFWEAIHGKYKNESRWISREDFYATDDAYVRFIWSFGNNLKNYLYSKELEPFKKACHYAIVFDDWSLYEKLCPETVDAAKFALNGIKDRKERRLAFGPAVVAKLKEINDPEVIKNNVLYASCHLTKGEYGDTPLSEGDVEDGMIRQQRLESLERLERLERHTGSYDQVEILPDSVIYCDIPYFGTDDYGVDFNFEKFYDWCERQTEQVFISSYWMPEDRFTCIKKITHRCSLSAVANNAVVEKVFMPKKQAEKYQIPGCLFNFDEMM